MHQSDRVKLQFGYYQDIPNPPKCLQEEHTMTMQESWDYSYTMLNRNEQQLWENRHRLCLTGVTFQGEMKPTKEYINWLRHLPLQYASIEQLLIDPRQHCNTSQMSTAPQPPLRNPRTRIPPNQYYTQTSTSTQHEPQGQYTQPYQQQTQNTQYHQPNYQTQTQHTSYQQPNFHKITQQTPNNYPYQTPQNPVHYTSQTQQQPYICPPHNYTPIPPPNFDYSTTYQQSTTTDVNDHRNFKPKPSLIHTNIK